MDEVVVQGVYRHPSGTTYRVDDLLIDTTGYEERHDLTRKVVLYTQLDKGEYPAGSRWVRSVEDFLSVFTYTGQKEEKN